MPVPSSRALRAQRSRRRAADLCGPHERLALILASPSEGPAHDKPRGGSPLNRRTWPPFGRRRHSATRVQIDGGRRGGRRAGGSKDEALGATVWHWIQRNEAHGASRRTLSAAHYRSMGARTWRGGAEDAVARPRQRPVRVSGGRTMKAAPAATLEPTARGDRFVVTPLTHPLRSMSEEEAEQEIRETAVTRRQGGGR